MKNKKIKQTVLAEIVSLCLAGVVFMSGCQHSGSAVFKIGTDSCSVAEAKVLLVNYQNTYGRVYGMDLLSDNGGEAENLESYIKDAAISKLAQIYTLAYIATDHQLTLSDDEQAKAEQAASAYYASLNEKEKKYMDVSEKDVQELYTHCLLAQKAYEELTAEVGEEVSDDDARVMQLQQICVSSKETADQIEAALTQGNSFERLAAEYNEASDDIVYVTRHDFSDETQQNQVFSLQNGAYSPVLENRGKYYIYNCINNFEQQRTEENKDTVLERRKLEAVKSVYDAYVKRDAAKLNQKTWEKVSLESDSELTSQDFFEVYEQYCGTFEVQYLTRGV